MFDPFFGFAFIGAPIGIAYLFQEVRLNPNTIPTVGTCLVGILAAYGVFEWLEAFVLLTIGNYLTDAQIRGMQLPAGIIAALAVGIPFYFSARARRLRAASEGGSKEEK